MAVTTRLASQLRKLSAREKAVVADHLWREAEATISPSSAQIAALDERAAKAIAHPSRLKPVGDAVRRLRR
jgi:hypothetical protein